MYIFRVEDNFGTGPYNMSNDFSKWLNIVHRQKPTPFFERLEFPRNYYCGFESIKQFKEWFSESCRIQMVKDSNFKLSKYLIQKKYVNVGKEQIVFDVNHACRIAMFDPLTLKRIK